MSPSLVVVWRVTERCDTSCPFCAYDARLARPRREVDPDEALRFGRLIAAARPGALIAWLGGEPFLWRGLARVSGALREAGARIGVTTNGRALADPAWRSWAVETLDELTLSVDGPPAIHDELRRRPGMGGELLEAIAALRARRGAGATPLLRVNSVLMRRNVEAFEELVGLVARAGADEITFNALGGNDRPEFFSANRLRAEDVDRIEGVRAAGIRVRGGGGYLVRLRAGARGATIPVDDCAPGRRFWFIEVDGRLAPCSFTVAPYGVPIAELETERDLAEIPARLGGARRDVRAPACADCPSTQVHEKFA